LWQLGVDLLYDYSSDTHNSKDNSLLGVSHVIVAALICEQA
jgi:hypothetical protein